MEFLVDYGAFLLKTATIVVAILLIVAGIASVSARQKARSEGDLSIRKLNEELEDYGHALEEAILDKHELKALHKAREKEAKAENKAAKKKASGDEAEQDVRKRVYVIDFDGDIRASDVDFLRQEVSAILTKATKDDEVVVCLESGGGMVHSYGLAASQLHRIREQEIPLTICVDKVAASGGYMMACLANHLVAAPFALVGSIGVMAQVPNFSKILKKHDVDYELFTAGEFKRTVTMFGHNTPKAREKFQSDLEETHDLFKQHIQQYRTQLDVNKVANGDVWYGQQALEMGLIDQVGTSDDYLVKACENADVFAVRYELRKTLQEKLGLSAQLATENALYRVLTSIQNKLISKS
ncbi:MAG: protease SohB [Oceanobacter sp.]